MISLGIDPGTTAVGYGVVAGEPGQAARLLECGVLRLGRDRPLPSRLAELHRGMAQLLATHRPDTVAVEGIFYGKNVRTTVVLGHARGVIMLAAEEAGIPVVEYSPATVKRAVVGNGRAAKSQVSYMVSQLLRLTSAPTPSDAADGVALALTHLLRVDRRVRAGLAGVTRR